MLDTDRSTAVKCWTADIIQAVTMLYVDRNSAVKCWTVQTSFRLLVMLSSHCLRCNVLHQGRCGVYCRLLTQVEKWHLFWKEKTVLNLKWNCACEMCILQPLLRKKEGRTNKRWNRSVVFHVESSRVSNVLGRFFQMWGPKCEKEKAMNFAVEA